ncbi:hypothetical protein JTE90_012070 [Oedothorax gibbosus]|uniref:Uncharacterized protein n=1 Tax=Oedothorax gibbosus TaxID=931172 RepID=A0AAV6U5Q5_9ARAC|nr:hypothetical protein JTE90_012070 [Oedothorax gibbosus]
MVPRTPLPSAASVNFGIGLAMVLAGCAMVGVACALVCLQKPVLYARDGRYDQLLMAVMPIDKNRRQAMFRPPPPSDK